MKVEPPSRPESNVSGNHTPIRKDALKLRPLQLSSARALRVSFETRRGIKARRAFSSLALSSFDSARARERERLQVLDEPRARFLAQPYNYIHGAAV